MPFSQALDLEALCVLDQSLLDKKLLFELQAPLEILIALVLQAMPHVMPQAFWTSSTLTSSSHQYQSLQAMLI